MRIRILKPFKETFLAGGAITITQGRGTAVDFAYPYFETRLGIISQKPSPLPRYQAIFWPFSFETWIVLLITVILFSVFYWVLIKHILKDDTLHYPAFCVYENLLMKGNVNAKIKSKPLMMILYNAMAGSPWPNSRTGIIIFTSWSIFSSVIAWGMFDFYIW